MYIFGKACQISAGGPNSELSLGNAGMSTSQQTEVAVPTKVDSVNKNIAGRKLRLAGR